MPRAITQTTKVNADFARQVAEHYRKSKSRKALAIRDAIIIVSKKLNTMHHVDPYLYNKAEKALVALICVAKPATAHYNDGRPVDERPQGEFNDLLGTKLFPTANVRNKVGEWAGGVLAVPADEDVVDGRSLQSVIDFETNLNRLLTLKIDPLYDQNWLMDKLRKPTKEREDELRVANLSMDARLGLVQNIAQMGLQIQRLENKVQRLAGQPA